MLVWQTMEMMIQALLWLTHLFYVIQMNGFWILEALITCVPIESGFQVAKNCMVLFSWAIIQLKIHGISTH